MTYCNIISHIALEQKVTPLPTSTLLLEGWPAKQVMRALEAGGVALWTWNVDTDRFTMDERSFDLWAVTP